MSLAQLLRMSATIRRPQPGPPDGWGNPTTLAPSVLPGTVRCIVYSVKREDVDNVSKHAIVEELRMMTPIAANVREGDELTVTHGRTGQLLYDGVLVLTRQLKSIDSRVEHASYQLARNR